MAHRFILAAVAAYVVFALAWDGVMDMLGVQHESFCDACAWWNTYTKGLFALSIPGLWLHVFGQQWLPRSWRGE
jgi:hypothetical protein